MALTHVSRTLVALACLAPALAAAQAPDFARLDAVVERELAAENIPGAAVAIVSGGRLAYAKGFGVSNVETGAPMTPDRLIRLGSTTKMFTAAALLMLAEEGLVDLHEPVGAYIAGLDPAVGRVTAHQLLSHTSGLLDEAPMYGSHDERALMEGVRSWGADRFFTEPGRIYSYSNPGYWLAGALIEAVSGSLFADYLRDRLFVPLGMTRTTLRPMVAMTYPLAQGHDVEHGRPVVVRPFANNAASWPAGSIFSSAADLSRFVTAFLGGGYVDGRPVLPPRVIDRLSTRAADIPGSDDDYGYGLRLATHGGVLRLSHGGSRSGYGLAIVMVPERQFGVIVVANRTGASLPRTVDTALEIGTGLQPEQLRPAPARMRLTERELAAYTGVYSQGWRTMEVVARGGTLVLKQGTRETDLRWMGDHHFAPDVYFVAGESGRIDYLHSGGRSWKKVP